jgi:hypothetical protein
MRDNSDYVSAKLNTQEQEENIFHAQDPFNKTWDDLKDLGGINQNFKRRTVRLLNKAAEMTPAYLDSANAQSSGIDGTGTKGINPGTVYRNGYGLFDIITPPYNMYELANFLMFLAFLRRKFCYSPENSLSVSHDLLNGSWSLKTFSFSSCVFKLAEIY